MGRAGALQHKCDAQEDHEEVCPDFADRGLRLGGALRGLCGDTGWIPHLLLPVAPGARPGPQGDYEVLHGGDRGRDQGYGHYLLDYHEGGYILREQGVLPEVDRL